MTVVSTIGHSTRSAEDFLALLRREGIRRLYDIRTFPGSRRYPHFGRGELAASLSEQDIAYEHLPALGGRRRPRPDTPPTAWRNDGFRGYADYMTTDAFRTALGYLIDRAEEAPSVIMCSEAVPWRCHRTMVSDALLARGVSVGHILDAKRSPHAMTRFAVVNDGEVTYPPGAGGEVVTG